MITTDSPGCRETIRDGVEGFLVPVRDSQALLLAMKRMLDNPSGTQKMAEAAFMRAAEKYDVHAVNRKMMSFIGLSGQHDQAVD